MKTISKKEKEKNQLTTANISETLGLPFWQGGREVFLSKFFFKNWKRGLDFFLRTITSLPASAADVQSKTFVYCLDQLVDSQVHLIWKGRKTFFAFLRFSQNHAVAADRKKEGGGANISPFPSPQASFSSVRFSTEGGTFFQLFCVRKEDERKRRRRKKPAADVFEIGRNLGGIRQ